jgi:hypothetical protein
MQRITMRIFRSADSRAPAFLGVVLVAAFGPCTAFATLGEPEATVQSDVVQQRASIKSSQTSLSYRVHEIQLPSGTLLREYVGANGNVFAVAWQGSSKPDLRQALGRYFDVYVSAPRSKVVDRKHMQIQQGDLVIEGSGHMRALSGRAYLASAIPSGVNVGDLN